MAAYHNGRALADEGVSEWFLYESNRPELQIISSGERRLVVRDANTLMEAEIDFHGKKLKVVSHNTDASLLPLIRWDEDGTLLRSPLDENIAVRLYQRLGRVIPRSLHEVSVSDKLNSLLGLLAVAFMSRSITEGWQKRQGLEGSPHLFEMEPPQTPVLVLQRREELRQNPFTPAAVSHMKACAV